LGNENTTFERCGVSSPRDKLGDLTARKPKRGCENGMRILVAFEESYRVYQDAIADAVLARRPHTEVLATDQDALEAEVARIGPDLVICSQHKKNAIDVTGVAAWFKVPTGSELSGELSLDGEYSEVENPGLVELLWFVDEAEKFLQAKDCS
jgi:hypothetical protein